MFPPAHPRYAAYGETFSKDKELQDRHPITANYVARSTVSALRPRDLPFYVHPRADIIAVIRRRGGGGSARGVPGWRSRPVTPRAGSFRRRPSAAIQAASGARHPCLAASPCRARGRPPPKPQILVKRNRRRSTQGHLGPPHATADLAKPPRTVYP